MSGPGPLPKCRAPVNCTASTPFASALIRIIINYGLKGEVVPLRAIKACMGSRGVHPLILKLGARWRLVINITPRPFYLREISPVPFE